MTSQNMMRYMILQYVSGKQMLRHSDYRDFESTIDGFSLSLCI